MGKDMPGHACRQSAVSCAKLAKAVEIVFGLWARVGSTNHVLDGGPGPPMRWVNLRGRTCPDMPDDTLM